jgi:prevent-host-death family protein
MSKPKARSKPKVVSEPAPASVLDAAFTVEVPAGVFKNTCLSLMDDVRDGRKEIVITKHGQPVAKLVASDTAAPSAFGFLRGTVTGHGDIVAPDWDAWGDFD